MKPRRTAALIAATTLVSLPGIPAAHATGCYGTNDQPSAVSTAGVQVPQLVFMSERDYKQARTSGKIDALKLQGPTPGRQRTFNSTALPTTCGGGSGYWEILSSTTDEYGRDVPTRVGDSTIAYTKMEDYHGLWSLHVINETIHLPSDEIGVSGTRYTYQGHVFGYTSDGHWLDVEVRVVGDQSHTTSHGTTPDGRPVGAITGYCVGYTICPPEVNSV